MVKFFTVLILSLFISNTGSTAILSGYKGINFGTSIKETAEILKTQGRELTRTPQVRCKGETLYYIKKILDEEVLVQYHFTPKSRKMNQVILQFNMPVPGEVKKILTAKYGTPSAITNDGVRKTIWLFGNGTKIVLSGTVVIYLDVRLLQIANQETEMLKEEKKRHRLKNLKNAMKDF